MDVLDDWGMDPTHQQFISRNLHPDNGLFYSPEELTIIWDMVPNLYDIIESREKVFKFHRTAQKLGTSKRVLDRVGDIDDRKAVDLIVNDTVKQQEDPLPRGLHEDCSLDCKLDHLPMENGD
jgi:hypothetical protein